MSFDFDAGEQDGGEADIDVVDEIVGEGVAGGGCEESGGDVIPELLHM
jgi:hypothetical protein